MISIIIFGITGQDGFYMSKLYKEAKIYGFARGITDSKVNFEVMDLARVEIHELCKIISNINPEIIYNFSGQSSVGYSFKSPGDTFESNYLAHFNLLEACALINYRGRIYSALSSEMIGRGYLDLNKEKILCIPVSPYGLSKLSCFQLNQIYREQSNLNIVDGILFNHESGRRRKNFFIGKILDYVKTDKTQQLELGDLSVIRNFGHALEYMVEVKNHMHNSKSNMCICLTERDYSLGDIVDFFVEIANLNPELIKRNQFEKRPRELNKINIIGSRRLYSKFKHGRELVSELIRECYDNN